MSTVPPPAAVPPPGPQGAPDAARILDRGYRRYTGPRTGMKGAVRTTAISTGQRVLGLRRSVWAKVLPVVMIVISYLPAVVFIGIVALSPDRGLQDQGFSDVSGNVLPTYGEYYSFIASAVILFVAFAAPEALCPDRRTGMLGLYLASPLRRDSYLGAKALGVGAVLSAVTVGPPLLLLVAFVVQGSGPDGPLGVAGALARILGAGLGITAFYTALSLAASSLTDRKAFASAGLILAFLVSSVIANVVAEVTTLGDDALLTSLVALPFGFVLTVHGETAGELDVTPAVVISAMVAWTLIFAAIAQIRYRRLQVTK